MSKQTSIRPMPSPLGTNRENLWLRTVIVRNPRMALDSAENLMGGGGNIDTLKAMRLAIENLLGELHLDEGQTAKILELLDEHVSLDQLPDHHPQRERARELAGDDENETEFADFLRQERHDRGCHQEGARYGARGLRSFADQRSWRFARPSQRPQPRYWLASFSRHDGCQAKTPAD